MNYQRIYHQLIHKAKTRIPPEGYIEHHHIIPKCLNGSNDKSNIVILTPEEHFVAHILLVKIHPEHPGLITAVARMCKGKGRKRRKLYGWLRRRHSDHMRQFMKECQSGTNNSQYGTKWQWIHKNGEVRKIKKGTPIPEGWFLGRKEKRYYPKSERTMLQQYRMVHAEEILYLYENGISTEELAKRYGWNSGNAVTMFLNICFPKRKKYKPHEKRSCGVMTARFFGRKQIMV